jgi:flagellar hook-associated protein 1 FlgK
MSLSSLLSTATSAMLTAQTGLNTVSNNISNVNTPGYVREVVSPEPVVSNGVGTGVTAQTVVRAANQFLEAANLSAQSDVGQSSAVSNILDQAQALFGDPTSTTGYFSTLNSVFSAFAAAANDPASSLSRTQAVNAVSQYLDQSQSISSSITGLETQADTKISGDVTQINQLLTQINGLNTNITAAQASGTDASDAQNAQSELISQLSSLVDVQVSTAANGSTNIRTSSGALLVGGGVAATLTYQPSTSGGAGQLQISSANTGGVSSDLTPSSGELAGLLSLRQTTLPNMAAQFSEFVTQTANAINQAHNNASAVPPPQTLTGQDIGIDLPTAIGNFTGKTSVAIVDQSGNVQQQVDIDFGAGAMTVNGSPTSFTPSTFLSTLNSELGSAGSASFSNGVLSISASTTTTGVVIADDATTPSSMAGEGFSQYFGLNNLITSSGVTNYNTGLNTTNTSGFNGGSVTLQVSGPDGSRIHDITVAIPSGGTIGGVLSALNSTTSGVGIYGQFSMDNNGAVSFTPTSPGSASISVLSDSTQWSGGGASLTQLFGIGNAQGASRVGGYSVRSDIVSDPSNLALAQVDLANTASNEPVLAVGDNTGALALSKAGTATMNFTAAGSAPAQSTTIDQYAAQLSGQIGAAASNADQATTNAQAVQTEANTRLQSVEGVNLDQELVNLTTYQQAYSSSARLIQAANDVFNALMSVVGG